MARVGREVAVVEGGGDRRMVEVLGKSKMKGGVRGGRRGDWGDGSAGI